MAIPYVFEDEIEHGVCKRLTPLIRRVICNNPGPFTYTGTTTFIVGNGVVAIIDPGPKNDAHLDFDMKKCLEEKDIPFEEGDWQTIDRDRERY